MAPDAETGEEQVAEPHDISDMLRNRWIAMRDDCDQYRRCQPKAGPH
jgi:hypothetical protein